MTAEEFYIEWSGEDDGEYVSMEFDDFLNHLSRFTKAYVEHKLKNSYKDIDILGEEIETYQQENKELKYLLDIAHNGGDIKNFDERVKRALKK